jgi:hypothetical protein
MFQTNQSKSRVAIREIIFIDAFGFSFFPNSAH